LIVSIALGLEAISLVHSARTGSDAAASGEVQVTVIR